MLGGILLFVAPLRAADPTPIACPNGQTIFLEGRTIPREALLIYLADRPVGGGLADGSGVFRLPLRAEERPGRYPVEVRIRASGAVVARFTCYVDVPLESVTNTPSPVPSPAAASPTNAATQVGPTRAASPTSTGTNATTVRGTATSRTPTVSPTGPTATASTTVTAGPSLTPTMGPSATPTPAAQDDEIAISDIFLYDPDFPEDEEYVEIENLSDRDITLTGWQLRNASRSNIPAFTFPQYVLESGQYLSVFSSSGQNDLDLGDFYWGQGSSIWQVGDQAELVDPAGNVISSYTVKQQ